MKQTVLPEVVILDVDNLNYTEIVKTALDAVCEEPVNEIGVI